MNYVIEAAFGGAIVLAVVAFILAPVGVDELIRRAVIADAFLQQEQSK